MATLTATEGTDNAYFDRLVNTIPLSFYYPDSLQPAPVQRQQKKGRRGQHQRSRNRNRAIPEPRTVLEYQATHAPPLAAAIVKESSESATKQLDGLRQKLHDKIASLQPKKKRERDPSATPADSERRSKKKAKRAKTNKTAKLNGASAGTEATDAAGTTDAGSGSPEQQPAKRKKRRRDEGEAQAQAQDPTPDFMFPVIQATTREERLVDPLARKKRKTKDKRKLLQQVESFERKLQTMEPQKAEKLLEAKSVENALLRARGVKVKDNKQRLKKSIKREDKRKEKSRQQWEARKQTVEESKKARIQKKQDNINKRKADRIAWKQGKDR